MIINKGNELDALMAGTPYLSYSYAYPHKTAYRPLEPAVPLSDVWANERKDALFLYFHIPFCEMRCGFCNLFTTPNPPEETEALYLDALERQARQVREALGDEVIFARMALGGGTPTYLSAAGLTRVFDIAQNLFGADAARIPVSVESSPRTAVEGDGPCRLRLLAERGVDRVSIGIQSFHEAETAAIGRAQKPALVEAALTAIRDAGIPTLNIDLMYGLPGQTAETWEQSLRAALRYRPEELYLYPLYVRPLTGMGKSGRAWDDQRRDLYQQACDLLGAEGYEQVSMRMFRAAHAPAETKGDGPVYCCQEDGMVGLGCGARSYTQGLQYSSEYAVGRAGVKSIIADYIGRSDTDFAHADYGVRLAPDEQRRRYILYTLLTNDGVDLRAYTRRFGTDLLTDLPQLTELEMRGLSQPIETHLRLTTSGISLSDVIGPWLYSPSARARMETFTLR